MSGPVIPIQLDRLADRADYAVIGPVDGRYRVPDASRAPYASVCHVQRDFGDGRLSGCTGFLIAPTVVVTAGHCVFSHKRLLTGRPAAPARIRVTPGRNGAATAAPFGSQWAVRWYVSRRFAARADRQCDYGVVVLRRPFARLRASFRLMPQSDAALRRLRQTGLLHIAGYPSDKSPGTQWGHHERLDRNGPRRLYYSIDTCPGHSGAPVWLKPGGDGTHAVIAIHTAGPPTSPEGPWGCRPGAPLAPQGMSNVGIRVTADVVRNIANAARGRTRGTAMVRLDRR